MPTIWPLQHILATLTFYAYQGCPDRPLSDASDVANGNYDGPSIGTS